MSMLQGLSMTSCFAETVPPLKFKLATTGSWGKSLSVEGDHSNKPPYWGGPSFSSSASSSFGCVLTSRGCCTVPSLTVVEVTWSPLCESSLKVIGSVISSPTLTDDDSRSCLAAPASQSIEAIIRKEISLLKIGFINKISGLGILV